MIAANLLCAINDAQTTCQTEGQSNIGIGEVPPGFRFGLMSKFAGGKATAALIDIGNEYFSEVNAEIQKPTFSGKVNCPGDPSIVEQLRSALRGPGGGHGNKFTCQIVYACKGKNDGFVGTKAEATFDMGAVLPQTMDVKCPDN